MGIAEKEPHDLLVATLRFTFMQGPCEQNSIAIFSCMRSSRDDPIAMTFTGTSISDVGDDCDFNKSYTMDEMASAYGVHDIKAHGTDRSMK